MKQDEALAEIMQWLESGKDFVVEQAPEVVAETLTWGLWFHGMGIMLGIFFLVVTGGGVYWLLSARGTAKADNPHTDTFEYDIGMIIGGIVGGIGTVLTLVIHTSGLVQVVVAPRVYILEQLGGLVGK